MKKPLRSIGIIMDGNRRFAKKNLKLTEIGHYQGIKKAKEFLEWAKDAGIKCVTAYVLSLENIKNRSKTEVNKLLQFFEKELDDILKDDHRIHETETRVNFIGRLEILPSKIQEKIEKVKEKTKNHSKYFFNIAIAYGGQQEIVDACKTIASKVKEGVMEVKDINEEEFSRNLYLSEEQYPDLIIRTGDVKRISNFLLWSSAYSELAFTEKLWPDLQKEDFMELINQYDGSTRRFGK